MESFLIAGAFFLMVFTPAIVGARNSARENRWAAGHAPSSRFRIPSLSVTLARIRTRRRTVPVVAVEDPLQALALALEPPAPPVPQEVAVAHPVPAQTTAYVKNFTFDVTRFNQPERKHADAPAQIAPLTFVAEEQPAHAVALASAGEQGSAQENSGEQPVSYCDPEPLYVRRAMYGQRLPRFAAQESREEMVPYPYAPPFAYPMPHYPMTGQVMPPLPQGYPQMPQAMGMPFPNPYLYPMAFMPMFPMAFYPMAMPGAPYGAQQQPQLGPQLVEPQGGYEGHTRWGHRSAVPYRSLYRRA